MANPILALELARLRSEEIRREVRGDIWHEERSRSSQARRRRGSVR